MEVWVVIFWIICGIGAATIAQNKGYSGCGWFIAGIVFGPIAVLVIGFMSPNNDDGRPKKICPYCAEKIQADANICRFCNRDLFGEIELTKSSSPSDSVIASRSDLPLCSQCEIPMKTKKATSGPREGDLFFVCPNYKSCGQVFPVNFEQKNFLVE